MNNPATFFISGNDQKKFTFEPREKSELFYIQARTKNYIPMSIIIPAADFKDAMSLFKEMLEFKITCGNKYIDYCKSRERIHAISYMDTEVMHVDNSKLIIDAIDGKDNDYTVTIVKAPLNQIFKVGWALNDTV